MGIPECVHPRSGIEECTVCESMAFRCHENDLREVCPVHPEAIEIEPDVWVCSSTCHALATTAYFGALRNVLILRGVPGSGKTYRANKLIAKNGGKIYSATDFYGIGANYRFDGSKLSESHEWCFDWFCDGIARSVPLAIVDNCNIEHHDYEAYVAAAKNAGYECEVIMMPHIEPWEAAMRNIHKVPVKTIIRMERRMQF